VLKITISIFISVFLFSCSKKKEFSYAGGAPGPSSSSVVGHATDADVLRIKNVLSGLHFPLPKGTVLRSLPESVPVDVTAELVRIEDFVYGDKAGRVNGKIGDYWINNNYVVRIAEAAYLQPGDQSEIKEEWAVVLSRQERVGYQRGPLSEPH
jgi:hypothetical protein